MRFGAKRENRHIFGTVRFATQRDDGFLQEIGMRSIDNA
jgi:hypothetical protein